MYGINNQMMDRIQKRLRQKIYREMIQQQQKYKQQIKRSKSNREDYQNINKTQPKDEELKNSRHMSRSYKLDQAPKNLEYQSTYLPVIPKKKLKTENNNQKNKYEDQYQKYLNRRKSSNVAQPLTNSRYQQALIDDASEQQTILNGNVNNYEQSDDEKTQQYLQQCQKIISSLKELTNKNGRKIKQKPSKYDVDVPFINKKPPLKIFNKNPPIQQTYSSTPKHYNLSRFPSRSNNKNNIFEVNQFQQEFKSPKSQEGPQNQQKNEFNQFNFNTNQLKLSLKMSGIRENNYKIQPRKSKQQTTDPTPTQNTQNTQKKKKSDRKTNSEANNIRNKEKTAKVDPQKPSKEKPKQKQPQENQIQKQAKKQNAIIKYLKKARVCGNLLYQKVESHKKSGDQEESPPPPNNNDQSP